MAAADYDRDGKLDLYLCCYLFFQTEAQYRYPVPYHDAQNGPPNFLFHNRLAADGSGTLDDVTTESGLDQNNNRTLTQVIGACFEAQTEDAYPPLAGASRTPWWK